MKPFALHFCLSPLLFAIPGLAGEPARLPPRPPPGIEELYRLDQLPRLKQSIRVASISSYDRTGGNNDGFSGKYSFVRKEPGGLVIADLKGPGVVYRIWTPTPTEHPVEFYFDGESKPRITIPFRDIFTGTQEPFAAPLVGYGAGGFYSYLPLPYRKSLKILVRAEQVRFYQINYAVYPESAGVKSFEAKPTASYLEKLERAKKFFSSPGIGISSFGVPKTVKSRRVTSRHRLKPGDTAVIFETKQPGRIAGLAISPASALAGKDRAIVLRAFWDGEKKPSILCPAGDFFGYAWGEPAMKSLLVGTSGDVDYLCYPMPFDRSARLELVSERTSGPALEISTVVAFAPLPRAPDEGKFYCLWRRENPTKKGKPFTFLETEGRGHIVGCIQQSQGFESGNTYFFEGDDQTTIDGELVIHGTGSEDFYNGGWYDVPGRWESRLSFPLSGCLGYQKHLGRTGGYRLMLGDAYAYHKSILQTIEHAPERNELVNDYVGVTYFYSREMPTCSLDLPPPEGRRVVDLKKIIFATWWNIPIQAFAFRHATLTKMDEKVGDETLRFLSLKATRQDWFGHPFISFQCELPAAGTYRVSIDAVRGPAQGQVQLFVDEMPVGKMADLYGEKREKAPGLPLATLELEEGVNVLLFKLVGKNEKSNGLGFDLTNIICERE